MVRALGENEKGSLHEQALQKRAEWLARPDRAQLGSHFRRITLATFEGAPEAPARRLARQHQVKRAAPLLWMGLPSRPTTSVGVTALPDGASLQSCCLLRKLFVWPSARLLVPVAFACESVSV